MEDPILLASHILCLNETKIEYINTNQQIHDALANKFNILSCYDRHKTIILYEKIVFLLKSFVIRNQGAKFICTTFNKTTYEALHIITIYKPPKMTIQHFASTLNLKKKIPTVCPTIIIGDFNVNMVIKTFESTIFSNLHESISFKTNIYEPETIYDTHLDHIWTHAPTQ